MNPSLQVAVFTDPNVAKLPPAKMVRNLRIHTRAYIHLPLKLGHCLARSTARLAVRSIRPRSRGAYGGKLARRYRLGQAT